LKVGGDTVILGLPGHLTRENLVVKKILQEVQAAQQSKKFSLGRAILIIGRSGRDFYDRAKLVVDDLRVKLSNGF
jgi:hypothetical protein